MKRFTIRWLAPMISEVIAASSEEAQAMVVAPGVLPKGAILQGVYLSDGPVPEQFGGPVPDPPESPPPTTPLRPKPIGGGQPGAGSVPVAPENVEAVAV